MSLANTARHYGSVAKTFHWITALMILTIIPVGIVAHDLAHDLRDPSIASTDADLARVFFLFSVHKTLGVVIFFVALARILWAISQPKPGLLNADKRAESLAAQTVHWLLYGSLLLVPLAGWIDHAATTGFAPIRWPFGQSLPFVPKSPELAHFFGGLHKVLEQVLVISLFLHVAGAIKHHVIDRDSTLRRMLPGTPEISALPSQSHSLAAPIIAVIVWALAIAIGFAIGAIQPAEHASAEHAARAETESQWQIAEGTLDISITQMGNQVAGAFDSWSANITFDETIESGPAGKVDVTIAIASLSLGSVTQQAMGSDFFDADFFPEASFSGEITRTDTGYVATGPLVIRDTSLPVTLPFDLTMDGDTAHMTGVLSLNRLDFGVGAGTPDEGTLGLTVEVEIALTATRNQ